MSSFYEGRGRSSRYMDVHEAPATPVRRARGGADDPGDWFDMRKSRPVEHLLPIAERWSAALPTTVRPDALIERFPRIANLLALQWSDANARAAYFDELLVDRRGHRQGFPPPVLDELLRLRNHSFGTNAG